MSEYASVERIKTLKQGIETKTGETYNTLTEGVQALADGYGVGSAPVLTDLEITENGEYTPPDGVDGFGKVTANVAGSGGNFPKWFQHVRAVANLFYATTGENVYPEKEVDLDIRSIFPNCVELKAIFSACYGIEKATLRADKIVSVESMFFAHMVHSERTLKIIDLTDLETKTVRDWGNFVSGRLGLETILGVIDFSNATRVSMMFRYCGNLKNAEFAPNTLKVAPGSNNTVDCAAFSDATLISLANALVQGGDSGLILPLHTTQKNKCDEIKGIVSTVTDSDTAYDFFTADPAGTVTLTEFITNTKGWTLA